MAKARCDISLPVCIHISCPSTRAKVHCGVIRRLARDICRMFSVKSAMISITIADNRLVKKLNRKFFGKSGTTDVISFDLSEPADPHRVFDIIINADQAAGQALKRTHPARNELALYLVHGMLHNLGCDDTSAKAAQKMHKTEDRILQQLGFGIVYGKKAGLSLKDWGRDYAQ